MEKCAPEVFVDGNDMIVRSNGFNSGTVGEESSEECGSCSPTHSYELTYQA
jgi:hypothetical protein